MIYIGMKKIYTWSNLYVHLGVSGGYWLLEFAQNYLLDFILCNSVIYREYRDYIEGCLAVRTEE